MLTKQNPNDRFTAWPQAGKSAAVTKRIFWCLGMYASASTWAFNVLRQIHEQCGDGPLETRFFSGPGDFARFEAPEVTQIVKSHEITDEATVLRLAVRADRILVTMRDPRDAVTSLMLYHGYEFERALPLVRAATRLCVGFSRDSRARRWDYERFFAADPATVAELAAWAGYQLPAPAALRIFAANTRQEVERYIAGLPKLRGVLQDRGSGDRREPHTHWHSHHAGRSGEIGRWRHRLSTAQAAEVEAQLCDHYAFAT